ncbi:hypothetical protein N-terminus, conserved [Thermococcus onnurineus NA1]|uniref:Uncharacterized protein n=1 Tax=Thermococcus onnurineus (strain NA1) TaxID=523850 RepID=B6YXI4_THEON|nr:DUF505 family protein [Thermococcus onnurineus]ACJ16797.1 hypothetical protein N-terminus, conserved [Thermococcus onnurineus NA1]
MKLLRERQLADENSVNDLSRELLQIYRESHPIVYLTPEIVSFLRGMPKIGTLDELVNYKNSKLYEDNLVNALQATRLLLISPATESGRAFTTTPADKLALRAASMIPVFAGTIILRKEDFEALKAGKRSEGSDAQASPMRKESPNSVRPSWRPTRPWEGLRRRYCPFTCLQTSSKFSRR